MKQLNEKNKKTLPPMYLLLSLVSMVVLHVLVPGKQIIAYPWNLLGVIPAFTGVLLNIIADRAFKKRGTTVKPFEKSTTLITDGVYAYTRHPMYMGFVLILVGLAVFMGSLTPAIIVVLFAILMEVMFIRVEERMLEDEFSDEWLVYKAQVRRWI